MLSSEVTEHKALAVVDGIKRYQTYLSGKQFYVHTNHGSLSWLISMKDPTGRLAHWALPLQQYDFDIIHRPGVANGNADALSRRRYSSTVSSPPLVSIDFPVAVLGDSCPPPNIPYDLQHNDPDPAAIIAYLKSSKLPESDSKAHALLLLTRSTLTVMDFFAIYGHLVNVMLTRHPIVSTL